VKDNKPRCLAANQLLRTISENGRHFFRTGDFVAFLELDSRGRVWFTDDYTREQIYTHYERTRWRNFSRGGTMRELIVALRKYIVYGTRLGSKQLGPFPSYNCGGDPWGYGEGMEVVREKAKELGLI